MQDPKTRTRLVAAESLVTHRSTETSPDKMLEAPAPAGLRQSARACLLERDLDRKVEVSRLLQERWCRGDLVLERDTELPQAFRPEPVTSPGLPDGLALTSPTKVRRRGLGTTEGKAAFVHAIAHIEWNAINLAWDAVWRFDGMPRAFYDDWTHVATEEAEHFAMLRGRLREFGRDYGDLPAHNGLWETAEATAHDLLARMALVPRVLEARGLDVTPGLIQKLLATGDEATAAILEVILRDEIGHVRIGSDWFHHMCRERSLAPAEAFEAAVTQYFRGRTKPLRDEEARRLRLLAGFREDELAAIERMAMRDMPPAGHW